jgi:WD40 repeat protein
MIAIALLLCALPTTRVDVHGGPLPPGAIARLRHGAPISSVAISPKADAIATAGQDGVVHVWDSKSGRHVRRLQAHPDRRPTVAFSSDGQRLIAWGSDDGTLRTWDARTGKPLRRLELLKAERYRTAWAAVSGDGNTAISLEKDRPGRFHDLTTGRVIREFVDITQLPIALSPAGDRTVWHDGTLTRSADRKQLLHLGRFGNNYEPVKFSADGRRLVAAVVAPRDFDFR